MKSMSDELKNAAARNAPHPSTVATPTTADYPARLKSFVYLITS